MGSKRCADLSSSPFLRSAGTRHPSSVSSHGRSFTTILMIITGPDVLIEESFLDVYCDLLCGGWQTPSERASLQRALIMHSDAVASSFRAASSCRWASTRDARSSSSKTVHGRALRGRPCTRVQLGNGAFTTVALDLTNLRVRSTTSHCKRPLHRSPVVVHHPSPPPHPTRTTLAKAAPSYSSRSSSLTSIDNNSP